MLDEFQYVFLFFGFVGIYVNGKLIMYKLGGFLKNAWVCVVAVLELLSCLKNA